MARCDEIREVEIHAHHSRSVMAVLAGALGICILQIVIQIVAFHASLGGLWSAHVDTYMYMYMYI